MEEPEEAERPEFTFQVGPNSGQSINLEINDMSSPSLGIDGLDISERESADAAIEQVDEATSRVSSQRGSLGAMENRLGHTVNYLEVAEENLTEARSRIRDADMAREISRFTCQQIIQQAGLCVLQRICGSTLSQQENCNCGNCRFLFSC